jgi:ABC-type spermidine/putrescine transport system permease subunit II
VSAKSPLRPRYLKLHAVLVFAFLFAPIVVLVVFSFNKARSGTTWSGFSTHWYSDLAHNPQALQAFRNTIKVAVVATVVATIIGTLAAFALTRFRFRGRSGYSTLIFVSLVMPEIVMAIALTAFFRRFVHVELSIRTVIAAHITFCIAFVVVVVKARLTAFDNRLVEAAADLGATPLQAFLRVVLPLATPGIVAGAMLAFTISLDDVVITSFTSGPGSTTLPLYIFGELKFGVSPSINALSTIVLLSALTLLAIGGVYSVRASKRGAGGVDAATLG